MRGKPPYQCPSCPYTTAKKSHLEYHVLTHTGEKPYKCNVCGKAFAVKHNFTKHFQMRHQDTYLLPPPLSKILFTPGLSEQASEAVHVWSVQLFHSFLIKLKKASLYTYWREALPMHLVSQTLQGEVALEQAFQFYSF
ncbi:hypothetical protein JTE90_007924 [Oedothorax gibbosus]|uniref:C2H2-type domain-containing protein n=1 Tax=Oedothorax gibbosus TaxID=931172 RepID=A0AAV6VKV4_9ARAC|nr:hypothetical protein JTE90_007924 [Oedothorax gibbosus]